MLGMQVTIGKYPFSCHGLKLSKAHSFSPIDHPLGKTRAVQMFGEYDAAH